MLFINSKTIPVSDCYYILRRMKAKIRPFDFHFLRGQVCACLTFSPSSCSFLRRQHQKGRSQRNGVACLAFKIKVDRYNGVKEKYVHTDVLIDFRELFMALFMWLKNRYLYWSVFWFCFGVFVFVFCLYLQTKMTSSQYLLSIEMNLQIVLSLANLMY